MKDKSYKRIYMAVAIIICLLVVVGIPLIINEAYKSNGGYITVWSGADLLTYYGTIIAALGGILGVFFTVRHSQKQYLEDARLKMMPYLVADKIIDDTFYKKFAENTSDKTIEDNQTSYHVITYNTKNGIKMPLTLPIDQYMNIEKKGFRLADEDGKPKHYKHEYYFLSLQIKNIGNAAAIKGEVGLFTYRNCKYEKPLKDRNFLSIQSLAQGESLYLGIYWDLNDEEALTTYKLDFYYSDLSLRRYSRSIEYNFERNDRNVIVVTRTDKGENNLFVESEEIQI